LYEDDGETYAYERGERATTALRWDDARRTLHIGARQGSYPGMVAQRELRVRVMAPPGQPALTRTVRFQGRALTLQFEPAPQAPQR
jgi:alpha-D-xyloside xylohydrolase